MLQAFIKQTVGALRPFHWCHPCVCVSFLTEPHPEKACHSAQLDPATHTCGTSLWNLGEEVTPKPSPCPARRNAHLLAKGKPSLHHPRRSKKPLSRRLSLAHISKAFHRWKAFSALAHCQMGSVSSETVRVKWQIAKLVFDKKPHSSNFFPPSLFRY